MKQSPLKPISDKRRAKLAAAGNPNPRSTLATTTPLARKPMLRTAAPVKRPKDTGPKRSVVDLLKARSGGICEWMGCTNPATQKHHRLNRKSGGRRGEMAERINGVAWLIHTCAWHHAYVTSAHGVALKLARRYGWLLREGQDATVVPVQTRHHSAPVLFTSEGGWTPVRGVAA